MARQRVAAIIIKNKKILLVRDSRADFFSMPGGTPENNENHIAALTREIKEEIGVTMKEISYYFSFNLINQTYKVPQTDHAYIVSIDDEPVSSSEITELGWFSKEDIINKNIKVPPAFFNKLFPKLVEENFF